MYVLTSTSFYLSWIRIANETLLKPYLILIYMKLIALSIESDVWLIKCLQFFSSTIYHNTRR